MMRSICSIRSCVDGQLELRDLDENTLFDIVEGGANGGTDRT